MSIFLSRCKRDLLQASFCSVEKREGLERSPPRWCGGGSLGSAVPACWWRISFLHPAAENCKKLTSPPSPLLGSQLPSESVVRTPESVPLLVLYACSLEGASQMAFKRTFSPSKGNRPEYFPRNAPCSAANWRQESLPDRCCQADMGVGNDQPGCYRAMLLKGAE